MPEGIWSVAIKFVKALENVEEPEIVQMVPAQTPGARSTPVEPQIGESKTRFIVPLTRLDVENPVGV